MVQTLEDCKQLQHNLNQLTTWCLKNRLALNAAKGKVMSLPVNYPLLL